MTKFNLYITVLLLSVFSFNNSVRAENKSYDLTLSNNIHVNPDGKIEIKKIKSDTLIVNNDIYIKYKHETNEEKDSIFNRYEKHRLKYGNAWNKMIPRYQKIQFFGSIGLVSLGTGWNYCNNKLETEFLLGYIPKYDDTRAILSFTLRENYITFNINIKSRFISFDPLTASLSVNSIIDDRFWKKEPERYPEDYYKFSTRIRFHLALGQRINLDLDGAKSIHKSISLFYEVGTCDLYMISAVTNKYLKPKDYLSLSFGLKLHVY